MYSVKIKNLGEVIAKNVRKESHCSSEKVSFQKSAEKWVTGIQKKVKKGWRKYCKCKNSRCLKLYCECYQNNMPCGR